MAASDGEWRTSFGLTPELARDIIRKATNGMPIAKAAKSLGVTPQRWNHWRKLGDAGTAPFAQFFERAQKIESSLVEKALAVVHEGLEIKEDVPLDTKLACWVLERQMPQEFHPNTRAVLKSTLNGLVIALRGEFINEPQIMQRVMTAMKRAQEIEPEDAETLSRDEIASEVALATTH